MRNFKYKTLVVVVALFLLPLGDAMAACFYNGMEHLGCTPHFIFGCCRPQAVNGCPACIEIPLDGGLSALLVAGLAFGARRMRGKVL